MRDELLAALTTRHPAADACRYVLSRGADITFSGDAYSARHVADIWACRVDRLHEQGIALLGPDLPERLRSAGHAKLRSAEVRGQEHTFVLFLAPDEESVQVVGVIGFPTGLDCDSGSVTRGGARRHPDVPPSQHVEKNPFRQAVVRTVRNGNNVIPGWLITLGFPAMTLLLDPFYVFDPELRHEAESLGTVAVAAVGLAVTSLLAYVCLARPAVDVTSEYLMLRNPLRETAVPRRGAALKHGMVMGFPTLLAPDGSAHTAWGAENAAPDLLQAFEPLSGETPPVLVRRRPHGVFLPLLTALWLLYFSAGFITWS